MKVRDWDCYIAGWVAGGSSLLGVMVVSYTIGWTSVGYLVAIVWTAGSINGSLQVCRAVIRNQEVDDNEADRPTD
jgi:hypothetical protein